MNAGQVVDAAVASAVNDIEFCVTSGVFEFYITDADSPGAADKLRRAVQYAR